EDVGVRTNLLGQRDARDYAVYEAPRLGVGRRVPAAFQDDLFGARRADEPYEAGGGRDPERHAQIYFRNPQLRLGRGPAEVAREREAPAAADRVPVDHRDRRLLEILQQGVGPLEEPPELALALAEGRAPLRLGHRRLEPRVGAGREYRRRPGHDDDARGGVVAQLDERGRELGEHRIAEGIAPVGTVQRDGRNRTV